MSYSFDNLNHEFYQNKLCLYFKDPTLHKVEMMTVTSCKTLIYSRGSVKVYPTILFTLHPQQYGPLFQPFLVSYRSYLDSVILLFTTVDSKIDHLN